MNCVFFGNSFVKKQYVLQTKIGENKFEKRFSKEYFLILTRLIN